MRVPLVLIGFCLLLGAPVVAADLHVPGEYAGIQAAIDAAGEGDVVIVAPGTYYENVDFKGKAITVRGSDPDDLEVVAATILDGGHQQESCVRFVTGEQRSSVLEGVTLMHGIGTRNWGLASWPPTDRTGGGVLCWASSPTIRKCWIRRNGRRAEEYEVDYGLYRGGGIAFVGACQGLVQHCLITNNESRTSAAGVYAWAENPEDCRPEIWRCTIANNRSHASPDAVMPEVLALDARPEVSNSILACRAAFGDLSPVWYCCLEEVRAGDIQTIVDGSQVNGNIIADPCFREPIQSSKHSDLGDYHILPDSPCINRGDPGFADGTATDIDGEPLAMGGRLDMGADEVAPELAVVRPAGGETFAAGSTQPIRWRYARGLPVWVSNADFETVHLAQPSNPPTTIPGDAAVPGWSNGSSSGTVLDSYIFDGRDLHRRKYIGYDAGAGLFQLLWDKFEPVTRYALTVEVGATDKHPVNVSGWQVALTAGDREAVVAVVDHTVQGLPQRGEWIEAKLVFETDLATDPAVAERIGILLSGESCVYFDNVRLKVESLLPPHMVDVLLMTDGETWTSIADGVAADTGEYDWAIAEDLENEACRVRVEPVAGNPELEIAESSLFAVRVNPADEPVDSVWPTLGENRRRTGRTSRVGPLQGCVKWQYDSPSLIVNSPTVGADGRIHLACDDGVLRVLDSAGELAWEYTLPGSAMSAAAVGPDGSVYIGANQGHFFALDRDGELRWTADFGAFIYSTPAVDEQGRLFFGTADGQVLAFAADGSPLWSFDLPGRMPAGRAVLTSPALADGVVYVGGMYDDSLYALDVETGELNWRATLNSDDSGGMFVSPVVGEDAIYATLLYDPHLYVIDPADGSIERQIDLVQPLVDAYGEAYTSQKYEHSCWSEPVLGPDGTIYVSFDGPYLRAINPDGSIRWMSRIGVIGGWSLVLDAAGRLYAAGDDQSLYVVDAATGELLSAFDGRDWLMHPVVAADGTLCVVDFDNTLWALTDTGCPGAARPLSGPGDANRDGRTDFADFAELAVQWMLCTATDYDSRELCPHPNQASDSPYDRFLSQEPVMYLQGDVDRDLYVDVKDLAALAARWLDN